MVWEMNMCLRGSKNSRPLCACVCQGPAQSATSRATSVTEVYCPWSRGWKPKAKVSTALVSPEASPQGVSSIPPPVPPWPPYVHIHTLVSSQEDTRILGLPSSPSCDLNDVFQDPKDSHVLWEGVTTSSHGIEGDKILPKSIFSFLNSP